MFCKILRDEAEALGFRGFFTAFSIFSRVHEGGENRYRIGENTRMRKEQSLENVALHQDSKIESEQKEGRL